MTEQHWIRLLAGSDAVVGCVRRGGSCDASDFIRALEARYQARYQRYLEYLRDGTPIQSPKTLRRLSPAGTDPVAFEIKVDKYRLYLVRSSGRWHATHGREKPKDNQVNHEVEKALTIFWESNGGRQ